MDAVREEEDGAATAATHAQQRRRLTLWAVEGSWRLHFEDARDATAWARWAAAETAGRDWRRDAIAALDRLVSSAPVAVHIGVPADLDAVESPRTANDAAPPHAVLYPVATLHGMIDGSAPAWADVFRAARLLRTVLARYTPALWRASGVRTVALARTLAFAGQRRQGVPDLATGTLHLALEATAVDPAYFRRMVHHELFHFLDHARSVNGLYSDPEWTALNAPGVRYASGGGPGGGGGQHQHAAVVPAWEDANVDVFDPAAAATPMLPPGMVTSYCLAGVEEDKAELFSFLMCAPSRLERLCASDAVVARKRDAMVAFVNAINGAPVWSTTDSAAHASDAWSATPMPPLLVVGHRTAAPM